MEKKEEALVRGRRTKVEIKKKSLGVDSKTKKRIKGKAKEIKGGEKKKKGEIKKRKEEYEIGN